MPPTALLFITIHFKKMADISINCLALTNCSGWLSGLQPQLPHSAGLCFIVSSTLLRHSRVVPSCPGCPPAFLSVGSRKLWFFWPILVLRWGMCLLLLFFSTGCCALFFKSAFSASRVATLNSSLSIVCSNVCTSA